MIEKIKDLDILIVEDGKDIRDIMSNTFNKICKSVRTAEDGQDGLNQFNEKQPDIILTDIRMPIMNGNEMIDKVKDINPDIPIIVISGHGKMISANKRANKIFEKPLKFDLLLEGIKDLTL